MSLINGAEPMQVVTNNPVVELLARMIAEAKAGNLTSIAIIGITPGEAVMSAYAGGQKGGMYVGTGIVQRKLLAEIEGVPAPARPPLVRATGLMG